ncbi:hypothetical protein ACJX0J_019505 [Zea mays]
MADAGPESDAVQEEEEGSLLMPTKNLYPPIGSSRRFVLLHGLHYHLLSNMITLRTNLLIVCAHDIAVESNLKESREIAIKMIQPLVRIGWLGLKMLARLTLPPLVGSIRPSHIHMCQRYRRLECVVKGQFYKFIIKKEIQELEKMRGEIFNARKKLTFGSNTLYNLWVGDNLDKLGNNLIMLIALYGKRGLLRNVDIDLNRDATKYEYPMTIADMLINDA